MLTGRKRIRKWLLGNQEHFSFVAVDDDVIVGFGDIDKTGYLDRLFVHSDYQGKGIPFFENRGYKVIKEQQVVRQDISLTNFIMEKCR